MHVTENVPHRPRTSACARPYFACAGLHNDFCESCRDLCIPTFRAKTGPVRLPCPTNAGRDSKKGCNFVTEGVRYANVCVRYVNTQQKSGTKGVIYEETILSLALTLCLLAGLLPCLTMGAAAAAGWMPRRMRAVEYTQNSGVKTGTVRYICQVPAYTDLFCPEYWGSYVGYANHECFTACISMALSYLGIDATPGALGDYWRSGGHYGTPFATTPEDVAFSGATYSKTSLAEAIARYVGGEGSYSPPIIHLNGYSANGHYVMIIGQVSATEYRVLDPAVKTIYTMTLTNGSTVNYFKGSEHVTEAVQYYYPVHHWSAGRPSRPTTAP